MATYPPCPGDYTHSWHGSTQTFYEKHHNTMLSKAILCRDCHGIWLKTSYKDPKDPKKKDTWEFYHFDPSKKAIQKRDTGKESLP